MLRKLRQRTLVMVLGGYAGICAVWACGSNGGTTQFGSDDAGGSGSGSGGATGSSGSGSGGGNGSSSSGGGSFFDGSVELDGQSGPETGVIVTTTIYANTDDSLYSVDPQTNAVTLVGTFAGVSDSSTDSTITDVAVNAAGDVYVNSESVIYKAALPATTPGTVTLTKVATISATSGTRFYALAFAPAGALGATEMLVGGDGSGDLWSIDPTSGATLDLGSFGNDPVTTGNILALSGDIVFYVDASGKNQGLATIRSCKPAAKSTSNPTCDKTNDFLAGVDMTALATSFTSSPHAVATSLNNGIYGGSATTLGNGIGHGEIFGLGAVEGTVIGFSRYQTGDAGAIPPALWSIDTASGTTSGAGSLLGGTFSFTNGWSGAGVTSKVTIIVPPPPSPPK
jgi:hypothetical protein